MFEDNTVQYASDKNIEMRKVGKFLLSSYEVPNTEIYSDDDLAPRMIPFDLKSDPLQKEW